MRLESGTLVVASQGTCVEAIKAWLERLPTVYGSLTATLLVFFFRQNPTQVGFQSYYGCLANVHDYYNHTFFDGLYEMRRERHENCGPGCVEWPDDRGVYNTHVLEREAKKVVEQHNKTNGPLFLYLSFNAVHTPLQVPKEYLKPYRRKNWDFTYKVYAGMLDAAGTWWKPVVVTCFD